MSRFFNQSADEQNSSQEAPPIAQPDSSIDQLLEKLRSTENDQVVSVRVPSSLEQFASEELRGVFGHAETVATAGAAASSPTALVERRPAVSLPMYPGRLAGSDDPVFMRAAELFRMVRT